MGRWSFGSRPGQGLQRRTCVVQALGIPAPGGAETAWRGFGALRREPGKGRAYWTSSGARPDRRGRVLAGRAGTADLRGRDEEVGERSQRPPTPSLGSLRETASRPRQVGVGLQPGTGAVGPRPLSCWRHACPWSAESWVPPARGRRVLACESRARSGEQGRGARALAAARKRAYQAVLNLDVPGWNTSNKR